MSGASGSVWLTIFRTDKCREPSMRPTLIFSRRMHALLPQRWRQGVRVVALDLTETYRAGLSPHLAHAQRVADPFHVTRVANRMLDTVRRRVQNETLGHRGRKADPLFGIRKLLLRADEHLDERGRDKMLAGLRFGDPHDEVLGAWLAKEAVRSIYMTDDVDEATVLLDNAIGACANDDVAEIRTMAHTLSRWRTEILNHHRTGASNGPTEGLNFCQAGQACRTRVHELRALQAARAPPRRRSHLAQSHPAASDHLNASPLKPEEPVIPHSSPAHCGDVYPGQRRGVLVPR